MKLFGGEKFSISGAIKNALKKAVGKAERPEYDAKQVMEVARYLNRSPLEVREMKAWEFDAALAMMESRRRKKDMAKLAGKAQRSRIRRMIVERRQQLDAMVASMRGAAKRLFGADMEVRRQLRYKVGQQIAFDRYYEKLIPPTATEIDHARDTGIKRGIKTRLVKVDPVVYIVGRGGMWFRRETWNALQVVRDKNGLSRAVKGDITKGDIKEKKSGGVHFNLSRRKRENQRIAARRLTERFGGIQTA